MSAEPTHAPVTYLEPVPSPPRPVSVSSDEALTELALALDTERSANKAMVQAVKELSARNQALEAQLVEYSDDVKHQLSENKRLWCEVRLAEHRYQTELDKPFLKRLFRRD